MIALVEGTIQASTIKTPQGTQKFEPHHVLKILQKFKGDAQLNQVKDYDLTAKYLEDSPFKKQCEIKHYDFNGNNGMTSTVINGNR